MKTFSEFVVEADKNYDMQREIIKAAKEHGYQFQGISVKQLKVWAKQLRIAGFSRMDRQDLSGEFEVLRRIWTGNNGSYMKSQALPEYQ